ncbi:hypothetical protein CHN51_01225 [Sphingorhabdus sp. YGSMI21]|nr:hypothetical protein CHN51_01225 [Sphingorhabdus sp. YGSMI21]
MGLKLKDCYPPNSIDWMQLIILFLNRRINLAQGALQDAHPQREHSYLLVPTCLNGQRSNNAFREFGTN